MMMMMMMVMMVIVVMIVVFDGGARVRWAPEWKSCPTTWESPQSVDRSSLSLLLSLSHDCHYDCHSHCWIMMMTMIVDHDTAVVSRVRVERDVVRCHVTQWLSNCGVQCRVWGQWLYRSMWALPIIIVGCYLCYCCCCCYYDYHSSLQSAVVGVWLWWWTWCEWMLARIDSGWMIEHSPPCLCVSTQDDDDVIIHIWWLCMMMMMNDDEWWWVSPPLYKRTHEK